MRQQTKRITVDGHPIRDEADWRNEIKRVGRSLTPEQEFAFAVLEARGLRFLVHFGFDNCVARAKQLMPYFLV